MSESLSALSLACLGLNHKTSPLEVRERFAVGKKKLESALRRLHALAHVDECVLLSTCNRTEVYFWTFDVEAGKREILASFLGSMAEEKDVERACFYCYEGTDALSHMARVASGLDSMVIGETEIFGQIKDAYFAALALGTTGKLSNRTFQRVFTLGKKVRSSTQITTGPTSVGAAAVQLAGDALGGLEGAHVLVVGAGDVARTTAQSLRSRGAEHIFVANRSYDRAVDLANKVGGEVIRFSEWIPYLEHADIVIVSTASPAYVVTAASLETIMRSRASKRLFLIDLSVPRNVEPRCGLITDVHLYDIDDMQSLAEKSLQHRAAEIAHCEDIIRAWVDENAADLMPGHPSVSFSTPLFLNSFKKN